MRLVWFLLLSFLIAALPACSSIPAQGPEKKPAPKADVEIVASNLQSPWSVVFQGDTIYISEREGHMVKIQAGNVERQPLHLQKPVYQEGEGGFLGIVLAPDFPQSSLAYAYHTYKQENKIYNRVIMMKETKEGWVETKSLLEKIPGAIFHNGGRLAIGPDQHLYITTGDALQQDLSQDVNSLAGKILRMTLNGEIPTDNPFPNSYVYSYGHRNPQGLAWDQNGKLYSSEHGPSAVPGGHDEINFIQPGKNYGWPAIIGDAMKEGMVSPLYHSGDDTWAPSGMTIDENNQIFVACLRGQKLLKFLPSEKKTDVVFTEEGRLRDVILRNGEIYVLTNNTDGRGLPKNGDDRLLRIQNHES